MTSGQENEKTLWLFLINSSCFAHWQKCSPSNTSAGKISFLSTGKKSFGQSFTTCITSNTKLIHRCDRGVKLIHCVDSESRQGFTVGEGLAWVPGRRWGGSLLINHTNPPQNAPEDWWDVAFQKILRSKSLWTLTPELWLFTKAADKRGASRSCTPELHGRVDEKSSEFCSVIRSEGWLYNSALRFLLWSAQIVN